MYDIYTEEEIISKVHIETANAERTRINSCFVMDESIIKEAEIHAKLDEIIDERFIRVAHQIARICLKKARNIAQECEKAFALQVCTTKSIYVLKKYMNKKKTKEVIETEEKQD
ncbi:uncharacterized protein LOC113003826 isoform X2 [Solenopsis invicta]|uniref:uncharacterized protein LOC113003826 isoform X2 n=1 Tax=Solenopsis invicta TaxID=13686 RepID=UPI000E33D66B|nr:uncharacterized protein LOC113003826 isoform X2 [Solenopsis invicta]